jgi:hypothetical protein
VKPNLFAISPLFKLDQLVLDNLIIGIYRVISC